MSELCVAYRIVEREHIVQSGFVLGVIRLRRAVRKELFFAARSRIYP